MNPNVDASSASLDLIRMIGIPSMIPPQMEGVESLEYHKLAFNNRLAFLYLQALDNRGKLDQLSGEYQRHLQRHNHMHESIRSLTNTLEAIDVDYLLIKTLRYYPENPNDIDIIVLSDDKEERLRLIGAIERLGYWSYNITLGGINSFYDPGRPRDDPHYGDGAGYIDIDVYREVTVHDLILLDKDRFKEHSVIRTFINIVDGSPTQARVLEPWLDLLFVYIHSIFPNRSYGLELFYTTLLSLRQCSAEDLNKFVAYCYSIYMENHVSSILGLTQELLLKSMGTTDETLDQLVNLFHLRHRKITQPLSTITFPYVFSLRFFLSAGINLSLRHKKGLKSVFPIVLRMFNPVYAVEVIKDLFSKRNANKRYQLKF